MKKNILLTGANSFNGSNLFNKIILNNQFNVFGLVREGSNINYINKHNLKNNIIFFNKNLNHLEEIIKKINPDIIIHMATYYHANHTTDDIKLMIDAVIEFPTLILDISSKLNKKIYFINTGTSAQHNNDSILYSPTSLHSSLKESFEQILQYYYLNNNINFTTLKLFHTYGPNDNRGKVISMIARSINNNEKLSLSPGDQEMDLVHCDDVTNAYIELCNLILNNQIIEKCYGVSSQKIITLKNLASNIEMILNKKGNFAWGEKNYKYREEMICWRSGLKLLPNWKPEIELFDGLQFLKNEFKNV